MKMEMADVIYAWMGMQENGSWDKEPCNCGNHPEQTEYYHFRIVEALRRENEELKAKLDKAKNALNFYAYCQGVDGNIGHRARTTLEELGE
jgi:hypothetical protein